MSVRRVGKNIVLFSFKSDLMVPSYDQKTKNNDYKVLTALFAISDLFGGSSVFYMFFEQFPVNLTDECSGKTLNNHLKPVFKSI